MLIIYDMFYFEFVVERMKVAIKLISILLLASIAMLTYHAQPVNTADVFGSYMYIYIRADGSIDPSEAETLINTTDKVTYRLYSNIYNKSIIVERDNIIINGYNKVIQGNYSLRVGIDLTGRQNVTLENIKISKFQYGVLLNSTQDCEILRSTIWENWCGIWIQSSIGAIANFNNVSSNDWYGISLYSVGNCGFSGNTICFNYFGINAWFSSASDFISNNFSANSIGINLLASGSNWLINNIVNSNDQGISLYECERNTLSGNAVSNNRFNFGIEGADYSHFATHNIDTTNTVNGKPIYYMKDVSDAVLDADTNAGTIYLINCKNVTVKNLLLTNNAYGVFSLNMTQSKIENVSAINNRYGIYIKDSGDNIFSQNLIAENNYGFKLNNSNFNNIVMNNISSNDGWGICLENSLSNNMLRNLISKNMGDGIFLLRSNKTTIVGNTIAENGEWLIEFFGINIQNSENNTIYHNNFINNIEQAGTTSSNNNMWDNGYPSGGNYWSDHTNKDMDNDGIAEDDYIIDSFNVDANPLAGAFHILDAPFGYAVEIVCNSTINNLTYYETSNTIAITVSNMTPTQTNGFCRLTIPHSLMSPEYQVIINGTPTTPITVQNNGTHSTIYISYEHSTKQLIIIPEYPLTTIISITAFTITLTTALKKKRHKTNPN